MNQIAALGTIHTKFPFRKIEHTGASTNEPQSLSSELMRKNGRKAYKRP
jgi:hypothetical protein